MRFLNRQDAGRKLAKALSQYRGGDVIVYALPRGGVQIGIAVAKELDTPIDLVITSKVGHPLNPEYAVCVITDTGALLCDEEERVTLDAVWLNWAVKEAELEAVRRGQVYLKGKKHLSAKDKIAIVVDDGVATGLTMRAALRSIRKERPQKIVVATPVASSEGCELLRQVADEIVVLDDSNLDLHSVGAYYVDFAQVSDREVVEMIKRYDAKRAVSHV